jgi:hypothetical protein
MSTAASDKKTIRARFNTDIPPLDAVQTTAKNKISSLELNYMGGEGSVDGAPSGTGPFKYQSFDLVGGTVPDNTDYPDSIAPIGSTYLRLTVSAGAVVAASFYRKTAAGTWTIQGAVPSAGNVYDEIITANVVVSSAELLALNATPKTLVAAAGAGKIIVPVDVQLMLDFATTAYDGIAAGEDLALKYTNASGAICATVETTGFLDAVADAHRIIHAQEAAYAPVANAALVLHLLTGEIATGDSPLKVRVRYKVLDIQS